MDRQQTLLVQLFNSPGIRRFFPSEPNEPVNSELFHILEQIWPIIREVSDSDEDCVRNIEMLVRISILLVDSGRLSFDA